MVSLMYSFVYLTKTTNNLLADDIQQQCDTEQEQANSEDAVVIERIVAQVTPEILTM